MIIQLEKIMIDIKLTLVQILKRSVLISMHWTIKNVHIDLQLLFWFGGYCFKITLKMITLNCRAYL